MPIHIKKNKIMHNVVVCKTLITCNYQVVQLRDAASHSEADLPKNGSIKSLNTKFKFNFIFRKELHLFKLTCTRE